MVKGNGKVVKVLNVTNMMENTSMIRSMVMVYFNGQVVIPTKENTKTMKETVMER